MAPKRNAENPQAQQSKRARIELEASTSQPRLQPPAGMSAKHKKRFLSFLVIKRLAPNMLVDWDVLRDLGMEEAFRGYFQDQAWERLFDIREAAYEEITLTFMASFELRSSSPYIEDEVSFYAFGEYRRMPMRQFIAAMGLYEEEELDEDEFALLPVEATAEEIQAFAAEFIKEPFFPSRTSGSAFTKKSIRVLHYMLVRSMFSKLEGGMTIALGELHALISMVKGIKMNVGLMTAWGIRHQAGKKVKGIFVDGLITRILKNLGLWPRKKPAASIYEFKEINSKALSNWESDEEPQEQETEGEAEEEPRAEEETEQAAEAEQVAPPTPAAPTPPVHEGSQLTRLERRLTSLERAYRSGMREVKSLLQQILDHLSPGPSKDQKSQPLL